ncbi:uncharacterized protein LOC122501101 [Leptopilina heterotoma]|uniref:uncharacterized protein LOC122501099 n=1 Tax=Leptopilina heterotoma TaxID=63436 RepID=UPI001CA7EA50|nr:uncharacterized protein LOC122501099 [Leptopilina heterotoma]XP_043466306.1 uncharacterized protein LOC122501101 [Leptopilina heterotoma]
MEFDAQHRKSNKSRGNCCVEGCFSKMHENKSLSFHKVPALRKCKVSRINIFGKEELVDKRTMWLKLLNVKDNKKYLLVCSKHFTKEDYLYPEVHAENRVLKKNAVPQKVKKCDCKKLLNDDNRQQRMMRRRLLKTDLNSTEESERTEVQEPLEEYVPPTCSFEEVDQHDSDCEMHEKQLNNLEISTSIDELQGNIDYSNVELQNNKENRTNDIGVQVSSGDFTYTLKSFIKTEKDLMTMCNIKSFNILNKLAELIDNHYPTKKRLLNTTESIVLTTAKLKLDISFQALGVFFYHISDVTIRNIFYEYVKKLSSILQSVLVRVPKEEILQNMPKCFEDFSSTTSVLDCTEIKIQKPKCLKCRIKFYSHYKGDLTVKFMTEVSPAGIITTVSESFGGRASDKCIFNHTGVLNHLESTRDSVMVDKGFLIEGECEKRRINLIRPPFLRNKKQLPEREANINRKIASARVHIERMNQRIKQFNILNNKLPWHLINYVDDIFCICCGLANLGTPILADDKF